MGVALTKWEPFSHKEVWKFPTVNSATNPSMSSALASMVSPRPANSRSASRAHPITQQESRGPLTDGGDDGQITTSLDRYGRLTQTSIIIQGGPP
jgi:hypothetical protein